MSRLAKPMPTSYRFDPADPRAPTEAEWAEMSPEERERVVATLPNVVPEELMPPEGDPHLLSKVRPRLTLDGFFRRSGRRVYVSGEMNVYYPGEPWFAPDLFAVLDVDVHERLRWVVSHEGRGLDLVIEVHFEGSRDKDYRLNVDRYARLGIREYFIFDCGNLRLTGYRLPHDTAGGARVYRPIVPQGGRLTSEVLGLEVQVDGQRLRFLHDGEPLPDDDELIAILTSRVDGLVAGHQATEAQVEAARAQTRAAEQRAADLQRQLDAALEEIDRLRGRSS